MLLMCRNVIIGNSAWSFTKFQQKPSKKLTVCGLKMLIDTLEHYKLCQNLFQYVLLRALCKDNFQNDKK